ncbi:MAG: hypothetical protein U5N58_02680 [Actinomycetota bacterium]|nr:hypothetical protein [Actinomycetota bacterium]
MRTTKKNIYISAAVLLVVLLLPFILPTFYQTLGNSNNTTIELAKPVDTNPGQFIAVKLKSTNSRNTQFPRGTAELSWGPDNPLAVEKFDIYIDNQTHSYYLPVGENPYWKSAGNITQVNLSLPQIPGIDFEVESLTAEPEKAACSGQLP